MKLLNLPWLPYLAVALLPASSLLAQPAADDLPHVVQFDMGKSEFVPGDRITIAQVRGSSGAIKAGETYAVDGTYELASHEEADLAFFATTVGTSGPTPVEPRQHVHVQKGSGSFHLVQTMNQDGYPHVSFYAVQSGGLYGGVYFGQGDWVLRAGTQPAPGLASVSGPNRVLLAYLGEPVLPPANLDARYTKEGLTGAIQTAARNAGITVKQVAIDDREFPFLAGVICAGSDFAKLKEQLRKLNGYEYGGGIGNSVNRDGSDTCNVFNLVPYQAYPGGAAGQVYHRLGLRQQVFYDQINGQK
jgi:hypothetical protein